MSVELLKLKEVYETCSKNPELCQVPKSKEKATITMTPYF